MQSKDKRRVSLSAGHKLRSDLLRLKVYYRKSPKDDTEWPPKYWKMCLTFDDDGEYACMDSRRFGRIKAIDGDPLLVPPLSLLGRDPLYDMPSVEEMQKELSTRSAPIKALILDQNALFGGIGNWLADGKRLHSKQMFESCPLKIVPQKYYSTLGYTHPKHATH